MHQILDILQLITLSLAGFGLLLAIGSLIYSKSKHSDRLMYFGLRVLIGSTIVAIIVLILARIC